MDPNTWLKIFAGSDWRFRARADSFISGMHEFPKDLVLDLENGTGASYTYWTEIAYQYHERLQRDCLQATWGPETIQPEKLKKILQKGYPEDAVFAVAFAAWWPLPMDKICFLIDLPETHPEIRPKDVLNYFLCDPETDIPEDLSVCEHYRYRGPFYRYESGHPEDGKWIDYEKMDPAFLEKYWG